MSGDDPTVRYREAREGFVVSLTVEVRTDGLYCRFSPLHRSFRRFAFEEIRGVSVARYDPSDYGGWSWGVRIAPSGDVAYRLSDDRGIELETGSGRTVFVGSEDPAALAEAVRAGVGSTDPW